MITQVVLVPTNYPNLSLCAISGKIKKIMKKIIKIKINKNRACLGQEFGQIRKNAP